MMLGICDDDLVARSYDIFREDLLAFLERQVELFRADGKDALSTELHSCSLLIDEIVHSMHCEEELRLARVELEQAGSTRDLQSGSGDLQSRSGVQDTGELRGNAHVSSDISTGENLEGMRFVHVAAENEDDTISSISVAHTDAGICADLCNDKVEQESEIQPPISPALSLLHDVVSPWPLFSSKMEPNEEGPVFTRAAARAADNADSESTLCYFPTGSAPSAPLGPKDPYRDVSQSANKYFPSESVASYSDPVPVQSFSSTSIPVCIPQQQPVGQFAAPATRNPFSSHVPNSTMPQGAGTITPRAPSLHVPREPVCLDPHPALEVARGSIPSGAADARLPSATSVNASSGSSVPDSPHGHVASPRKHGITTLHRRKNGRTTPKRRRGDSVGCRNRMDSIESRRRMQSIERDFTRKETIVLSADLNRRVEAILGHNHKVGGTAGTTSFRSIEADATRNVRWCDSDSPQVRAKDWSIDATPVTTSSSVVPIPPMSARLEEYSTQTRAVFVPPSTRDDGPCATEIIEYPENVTVYTPRVTSESDADEGHHALKESAVLPSVMNSRIDGNAYSQSLNETHGASVASVPGRFVRGTAAPKKNIGASTSAMAVGSTKTDEKSSGKRAETARSEMAGKPRAPHRGAAREETCVRKVPHLHGEVVSRHMVKGPIISGRVIASSSSTANAVPAVLPAGPHAPSAERAGTQPTIGAQATTAAFGSRPGSQGAMLPEQNTQSLSRPLTQTLMSDAARTPSRNDASIVAAHGTETGKFVNVPSLQGAGTGLLPVRTSRQIMDDIARKIKDCAIVRAPVGARNPPRNAGRREDPAHSADSTKEPVGTMTPRRHHPTPQWRGLAGAQVLFSPRTRVPPTLAQNSQRDVLRGRSTSRPSTMRSMAP